MRCFAFSIALLALAACSSEPAAPQTYTYVLDQLLISDAPEYIMIPDPDGPGPDGTVPMIRVIHRLDGLDIDGSDGPVTLASGEVNPCNFPGLPDPDFTSPDGETGVDNAFGSQIDQLTQIAGGGTGGQVRALVQQSISVGQLVVLLQFEGVDSFENDDTVTARIYAGLQGGVSGTDGRLLAGQTFRLNPDIPPFEQQVRIVDGVVEITDLRIRLEGGFSEMEVNLPVFTGRIRLRIPNAEVLSGVLGAAVEWQAVRDAIGGVVPENLQQQLESVMRGLADIYNPETGQCDGMSATFRVHAVPAFILEEDAQEPAGPQSTSDMGM